MSAYQWLAPGRRRQNGPAGRLLATAVAIGLTALLMAMAFGVYVNRVLALHLFLGGILTLAFLTITGNPRRPAGPTRISWLLVAASWAASLYFVGMNSAHAKRVPMIDELSLADMTAAILLAVLVLEATRRCTARRVVGGGAHAVTDEPRRARWENVRGDHAKQPGGPPSGASA